MMGSTSGRTGAGSRSAVCLGEGRFASEAMAEMAAKVLEANLGTHVRIPPLPPARAAHLFARARRDALWVGGYYRKLSR